MSVVKKNIAMRKSTREILAGSVEKLRMDGCGVGCVPSCPVGTLTSCNVCCTFASASVTVSVSHWHVRTNTAATHTKMQAVWS